MDEPTGKQMLMAALKQVFANPRQTASDVWQAPQNLIGLAQGVAKTGKLPTHALDEQGNAEFRFETPGEDPLTVGSAISGDSSTMSPDQLEHERVHTEQSRRFGPAYIPARMISDAMSKFTTGDAYVDNPLEDEAYLRTATPGDLLTRLQLKKAYMRGTK